LALNSKSLQTQYRLWFGQLDIFFLQRARKYENHLINVFFEVHGPKKEDF
jgi:hypothetical protein